MLYEETPSFEPSIPLQSAAEERAAAQLAFDLLRREYRDDPDLEFGSDDDDCEREEPDVDQEPSIFHEVHLPYQYITELTVSKINVDGTTAGRRNLKHRRDGEDESDNPWFPWANKQMNLIIWLAMFNGAKDMPSERQMQDSDKLLQDLCGIETIDYIGAMGNRFSVNSLADMLAQEWANPLVSPHLHTLPEDAGQRAQEAWHAEQWMTRLPLDLATPMIRHNNLDYYVFEPAQLSSDTVCMPLFFSLLMILGTYLSADAHESRTLSPWTRTDPTLGNRWRVLANGARVKAAPVWLYGDDTSGNQSKKWNKHNSLLFTLAGLPRAHAQKEFHIHFLTTSNLAPPMEMLDAIVSQFEEGQETGIWAYDCHENELVLLIPSVFAMLGDNPMQSEFCCHIGMRGRFFCRSCLVEGKARKATAGDPDGDGESDAASSGGESAASHGSTASEASVASQRSNAAPASKKFKETLQQMVDRVRRFTKFTKLKTAHGLKDTFFEPFAHKLFDALKKKRGGARSRAAEAFKTSLPPDLLGPLWRLDELDPHQDTPVEILHVVLLGIIKYFWRDAVKNQCKSAQSRAELIARLNSFDTSGLGIPPLRGETLVTYAGSLVGRDFRAIAQSAPFVLHGLVNDDCYRAWTYLANLVPQIWQPEIVDMDAYLERLTTSINDFLAATALWTPQWFNKPKFHVLLHLPAHIRRFGPAILFATEGFESFNAAPSRDIARAFAQGDRVRHLLSGGFF
ncbi:hypothetical protein EXIGLDRAFT_628172, partial [Exidia glandulosa HHB12029]